MLAIMSVALSAMGALAESVPDPGSLAPAWIQAGGVALFAGSVWWELRAQRQIIAKMSDAVVAILERDRMRDTGVHPRLDKD